MQLSPCLMIFCKVFFFCLIFKVCHQVTKLFIATVVDMRHWAIPVIKKAYFALNTTMMNVARSKVDNLTCDRQAILLIFVVAYIS